MTCRLTSAVLVIAASAALAAQAPATRYDRAADTTVHGTIKALVGYAAPDGTVGVHFDLKTSTGMISVHVAPATYIGQQNFFFNADEEVGIVGSRMAQDGRTTIWAKAIMKGSTVLVLRQSDGAPKWTPPIDGTDGCGVVHPPLPRETEY